MNKARQSEHSSPLNLFPKVCWKNSRAESCDFGYIPGGRYTGQGYRSLCPGGALGTCFQSSMFFVLYWWDCSEEDHPERSGCVCLTQPNRCPPLWTEKRHAFWAWINAVFQKDLNICGSLRRSLPSPLIRERNSEAWRAAIHGVAKSPTGLSNWTEWGEDSLLPWPEGGTLWRSAAGALGLVRTESLFQLFSVSCVALGKLLHCSFLPFSQK